MTLRPALLSRIPLLFAAVLAMAACSQETPTATGSTPPAATTPAATPAPAPVAGAAADLPPAAAPAAPAGPIVPPAGPAPVAGTDYVEIPGGQPFKPGSGKIEVAEAFGYSCPACARFEPLVSAWKAKLPADVQFVPVAAPFGGYWIPYAKAFYTAESMGLVERSHDAMFRAIHIDRSLPVQPLPTDEQLAAFYANFGADPKQFLSTMSSFAIDAKLKRAQQFLMRSGVESTPVLVVDGKYRVTGESFEEILRITDHLLARERAARAPVTPADAGEPVTE